MSVLAVGAGVSLAMGVATASNANAQGKRAAGLAAVGTEADNKNRESRNQVAGSELGLANWMQAENNRRKLDAAGENFNSGQMMIARTRDADLRGSLEQQIAEAEAAGAFAANTVSKGVGGNSSDIIDLTMRLKNSRAQVAKEKNQGQLNYEQARQVAGVIPQAVAGLGQVQYNAGIDFSKDVNYDSTPTLGASILGSLAANPNLGSFVQAVGGAFSSPAATSTPPSGNSTFGFKNNGATTSGFRIQ